MLSCVVVFDGRVTRIVYDHKQQGLLGSCLKFSQTVVVARSVTRLDGARGKKQVWRPHVRV